MNELAVRAEAQPATIEVRQDITMRCFAVVPTFNRPAIAAESVRALLDQTVPLEGIILVENAAEPQFEGVFPPDRVTIVRPGRNLGSAGGYAFGTQAALERGATHVMLVDDDCLIEPTAFEHLIQQLERTPDAIVGPITTTDGFELTWGRFGARGRAGGRRTVEDLPAEPFATRGFAFHGLLLRADAIRKVGGPRGDFFLGAEDVELCRRLSAGGYEFYSCPEARARHHAPPFHDFWLFGRRQVPVGTPGHRYYVLRNRLIIWRLYHDTSFGQGVVRTVAREFLGAFVGGRPLRRLGLLARALKDGLIGDPRRELRTDIPVFG